MTCESCGEKPKNSSKDFTRAVLEINNPEQITLLRKVVIPVSMGTEEQVPAAIGKYYNVILHYEANGHTYLYSSDGIPTQIQTEIPQEIWDSLQQLNIDIDNEEDARKAADKTLQDNIDAEAKARGDADTALDGRLTTVEGIASTALQPSAINKVVMTDISLNANSSTTTVQIDEAKENLLTGTQTTKNLPLPVASSTQAGVMNSSTFDAVTNNTSNISALMNGAVAITGLSASPSQSDLTTAWETETGLTSLMNRAGIYDVDNNKVWTYYSNTSTWYAASNTSQVTINTFTNSSEGTIKGSTNVGQVFAESDGTGSVNGWDTLSGNVSTNTNNISSLQTGKQDKLTAGANITISAQNVISADNNSYTAGNAIDIDGNNVISADIYPGDFFTAESTISGTGSDITLNDTLEAPLKSVELKGDTYQQTYSGKNAVVNLDDVSSSYVNYNIDTNLLSSAMVYSFTPNFSATGITVYVRSKNSMTYVYSVATADIVANQKNTIAFTLTNEQITNLKAQPSIIQIYKANAGWESPELSNPMLESGSTATDYEPYVGGIPSPNPDYPQDIQVVAGEQTVKVTGKNLLNVPSPYSIVGGGTDIKSLFANYEIGETYTISCGNVTKGGPNNPVIRIVGASPEYLSLASNSSINFTMNSEITHIYTYSNGSNYAESVGKTSIIENLMIEEGSTATTYESYQSQDYKVHLTSKNLFDGEFGQGNYNNASDAGRILSIHSPKLVSGEEYTVSCSDITGYRYAVLSSLTPLYPGSGGTLAYDSGWKTSDTFTFTANGDWYIAILVSKLNDGNLTPQDMVGLDWQVEESDQSTDYTPYYNYELAKIGTYQDYIYKSGDDWYVHKETGKRILDGSASWGVSTRSNGYQFATSNEGQKIGVNSSDEFYCDNFAGISFNQRDTHSESIYSYSGDSWIRILTNVATTNAGFQTWLSTHNTTVYYILETPTDTKITDSTLIGELEALWNTNTYLDTTNFFVTATGSNLPVILDVEAARKSLDGIIESIPTVNDATLTIQKNGTNVTTFTANASTNATANILVPTITMTDTDPGEGSPLAADNFVGVYGGDPIILDYSTTEINTGAKWIDGSAIYKKTIYLGNLPNATQKTVSHGISNLKYLVHMSGGAFRPGDNGHFPLPYPSNTDAATINISAGPSDIFVVTGSDRSSMTGYVTMYYTKNS